MSFWKLEACGQTMLSDMSIIMGWKLVENAKIQKFKCDSLSNFQTMWRRRRKRKSFEPSTLWHCWLLVVIRKLLRDHCIGKFVCERRDQVRKKDCEAGDWRIFLRLFKRQMTFVYCHSSYARKRLFYHTIHGPASTVSMTKTNFLGCKTDADDHISPRISNVCTSVFAL